MEQWHAANSCVCFVLGGALNSLLLWMIARRTPTELRPYSRILLQTVVLDMQWLVVNLLFHPVIVIHGGHILIYAVGPLAKETSTSSMNVWVNLAIWVWWMFSDTLLFFSLPLQFYYRYKILCSDDLSGRDEAISLRGYTLRAVISASVSLFCSALGTIAMVLGNQGNLEPASSPVPQSARWREFFTDYQLRFAFCLNDLASRFSAASLLVLLAFTSANYALVAHYSARVWLHMRRAMADFPEESAVRRANRQLNATLLALAAIPFAVGFMPDLYLLLRSLRLLVSTTSSGNNTSSEASMRVEELVTDCLNWQPVFNALVTLFIIKPYRREVLGAVAKYGLPCFPSLLGLNRGETAPAPVMTNALPVSTAASNPSVAALPPATTSSSTKIAQITQVVVANTSTNCAADGGKVGSGGNMPLMQPIPTTAGAAKVPIVRIVSHPRE